MKIRTLKRKVIIREYDYRRVRDQALCGFLSLGGGLYDRAEFTPLNQEALEKLQLIEILKGRNYDPLVEADWSENHPAVLLYRLKDYLYDKKYVNWTVTLDEEGFVCVQARKNTPKTRIGWAVFEKDLKSRL